MPPPTDVLMLSWSYLSFAAGMTLPLAAWESCNDLRTIDVAMRMTPWVSSTCVFYWEGVRSAWCAVRGHGATCGDSCCPFCKGI